MRTNGNRSLYGRSKLRYPSGLADEEWALIDPCGYGAGKKIKGKRRYPRLSQIESELHREELLRLQIRGF